MRKNSLKPIVKKPKSIIEQKNFEKIKILV